MYENNDIDITGWDLKKSLQLLRKSNASMLERIQSPIIYKADEHFIEEIRSLAQSHYSKIATMHHYLSMTKKFVFELEEEQTFKLKKFFYALRSAFVCKWIIEKDEMPPIEFNKIYLNLGVDSLLIDRINELIQLKSTIKESYFHEGETELIQLMKDFIQEAESIKNDLPSAKGDNEEMNLLFRKYITKYDN